MHNLTGKRTIMILSAGLVFCLAFLACGLPARSNPALALTTAPTQTPFIVTAAPNRVPSVAAITPAPSSAAIPVSGNQTPAPITHLSQPGTPPAFGPSLTDLDSSSTASQHYPTGGDDFANNLFERPFNANTQDTYFPQVDILKSSMVNGSPWVYGSITLKAVDPNTSQLDGSYALELDLNKDGRGDVLVLASYPAQGNWTTNYVQVYMDNDHDIGAATPLHPDPGTTGSGYEQKIFDSGAGNDPDLAWSMVSPAQPNVVWIAFKSELVNNASQWMWGAWAQNGGLQPELFDYNDHFSQADAGNPMPGNADYPIKKLAELDSTCRAALGFTPSGNEPGLCPLQAAPVITRTNPAQPTSPPKPTSNSPKKHKSLVPTTAPTSDTSSSNNPTSAPTKGVIILLPPGDFFPTSTPTDAPLIVR